MTTARSLLGSFKFPYLLFFRQRLKQTENICVWYGSPLSTLKVNKGNPLTAAHFVGLWRGAKLLPTRARQRTIHEYRRSSRGEIRKISIHYDRLLDSRIRSIFPETEVLYDEAG